MLPGFTGRRPGVGTVGTQEKLRRAKAPGLASVQGMFEARADFLLLSAFPKHQPWGPGLVTSLPTHLSHLRLFLSISSATAHGLAEPLPLPRHLTSSGLAWKWL